MGIIGFFKKAFSDMKESARAQHEVDKAEFEAARAESKANWDEARAMGRRNSRIIMEQKRREEKIAEANARRDAANERREFAEEAMKANDK